MSALALPSPVAAPAPALSLPMYRFTVKQYHGLIQAGILNENDRCELLEGWIIDKMPQNPPHSATITRIGQCLERLIPDVWLRRIQCPVVLKNSEPEPDIAVVRGPGEKYYTRHPGPKDVALLIEVADATLTYDREAKGSLYARERIPFYWIANLIDGRVEVFTEPKAGKAPAYRQRRDYAGDEAVPLFLNGREIARIPARELLP